MKATYEIVPTSRLRWPRAPLNVELPTAADLALRGARAAPPPRLQKAALVFQPADQGNGLTLMRWLFALSKLELVFFIANLVTLVVGVLLLFDIAGATLINWR